MISQSFKLQTKPQIAARLFASVGELFIVAMILLILAALLNFLFLHIFAGRMEGFASLASGASAYLLIAAVCCIIPVFLCLMIAEEFDQSKAMDGYVFEFLFDLFDRAEAFFKSRLP